MAIKFFLAELFKKTYQVGLDNTGKGITRTKAYKASACVVGGLLTIPFQPVLKVSRGFWGNFGTKLPVSVKSNVNC